MLMQLLLFSNRHVFSIILTLIILGKFFFSNGKIYEGECKRWKGNGLGNEADLVNSNWVKNTNFLPIFEGVFLFSNGDRYEGTIKDGKMDGNGNWIN